MNQEQLKLPDTRLATVDKVEWPELASRRIDMDALRLDKIHPVISGNKWFKLHPYLQTATGRPDHLLTFGGAWSNHIIAAAYASREAGIPITGIIRGERAARLSETLQAASGYGMQLEFISREQYRKKDDPDFSDLGFMQRLSRQFPHIRVIPEGGAGPEGIRGSEEILQLTDQGRYTHILCAIGTGTMYHGLSRAASPGQTVIGIPVLKGFGDGLTAGYHFGGYARKTDELLDFMNRFYQVTGIPTDFVYTGKLFFAALDLVRKELFPSGSRLLVIHSGGLQGNRSLSNGILAF